MTDHTDLRRRLLDLADRIQGDADRDLVLAGLNAIEALVRERDGAEAALRDRTWLLSAYISEKRKTKAVLDEALALLRRARGFAADWRCLDGSPSRIVTGLVTRIDALLAKTGRAG